MESKIFSSFGASGRLSGVPGASNFGKIYFMESTSVLRLPVDKLITVYTSDLATHGRKHTPIHVDAIASKLARFYEMTRKVIDWKDDNVLRRSAIERILKRVLFPKITGLSSGEVAPETLAEKVTVELIRGGHLPNDEIPRERVTEVGRAFEKYLYFLESHETRDVKKKINYANFVLEIAACEIEEILTNPVKELGLIYTMTELLDARVDLKPENSMDMRQKQVQVYVSVCRTLYDLDDTYIIYRLLDSYHTDWRTPSKPRMHELALALPDTWASLKKTITLPVSKKFTAVAENLNTVFVLMDDIFEELKEKPDKIREVFENKSKFIKHITKTYEKRYKTLKRRLFRLAIFSTLSVFLSNWFTFFIVEVPLAKLFYEKFNLFAATVDFIAPTALMFLLVILIRPPRKDNVDRVITAALGFVYKEERADRYQIRITTQRMTFVRILLMTIYIYTVLMVFAGIAYGFYIASLPITSVIFDTFTIALTVYAAVIIKNKAREINVDQSVGFFDFVMDALTLPIAKVGSFFAAKWKEYNIVAILFNFIVETPFVAILDFIQEWSEFLRERRAELR